MTPSGIELATFRLVTQCLNQLRHRLPPSKGKYISKYFVTSWEIAASVKLLSVYSIIYGEVYRAVYRAVYLHVIDDRILPIEN